MPRMDGGGAGGWAAAVERGWPMNPPWPRQFSDPSPRSLTAGRAAASITDDGHNPPLDPRPASPEVTAMPLSPTADLEARRAAEGAAGKRDYVRGVFSQIAPRYDLLNRVLSFNVDRGWRRVALAALGWSRRPAGTYLDLCAGTMDVAAALVGHAGFHGDVVAADFAEPMLRVGRHKVAGRPVAPVAADALRLPLANEVVDGAVTAFGARNLADLDAGLREVHRVLAPGARFVILEFSTPRSAIVRGIYALYFHNVLPAVGALVSGHRTAYRYLPQSVATFPVQEELAARMRRAGFVDVSWRSLTLGIAAVHVGTRAAHGDAAR